MRSEHEILSDVRILATEYYELTGKPLGVTGEIAEFEASEKLGLELAPPRTEGYDATYPDGRKVQIKGRRLSTLPPKPGQRMGKVDLSKPFDSVALVLLGPDFELLEIWEAPRQAVKARLEVPGSRARTERGQLGVSQFRSVAVRVWPTT
jgi:hypothetical protein